MLSVKYCVRRKGLQLILKVYVVPEASCVVTLQPELVGWYAQMYKL